MLTKCFEAALAFAPWLCALGACLLAARRALSSHVRARAFRAAWLVLAVRAALPVQFTLPHPPVTVELPAWSEKPVTVFVAAAGAAGAAGAAESAVRVPPSAIATGVWAAGAAALALLFAARYAAFVVRLRRSRIPLAGHPRVYRSPLADAPFACGLLCPAVYLPEETEPDDIPYILAHETRHIRAGDLWFRLILLAARCVQWFNPMTHVMARAAHCDMELACDEAVLDEKTLGYRIRYAQAILNAMRSARREALLAAPLCGRGTRGGRWKEIFNMNRKRKGTCLPVAAGALVLSASLLMGCAAGTAEPAPSADSPQSSPVELAPVTAAPGEETEPEELVWPVPEYTYLARGYQEETHPGLDICAAANADILAVQGGTVEFGGWDESNQSCGNYVQIDCGDGLTMLYLHCNDVYVQEGETVEAGDRIASVGSTGMSTGNHCCLRMERDGAPFDPEELLTVPR